MTNDSTNTGDSQAQPNQEEAVPSQRRVSGQASQTFADTIPIQEEGQYRMIAEAIPQIVWTARPDGYNDYFNQRWFEYTGLTHEQTYDPKNQGWPDFQPEDLGVVQVKTALHPADYERYVNKWREALHTGKAYEIEYRFRRTSDGMYRWHLGRAVPIRDSEGHIIKWFGTCTDIHDQKMAEEKMRDLNKELERKVEERTQELQAAQQQDRANLQRLKEILDNLPMGAIALDENDKILHYNDQFRTVFGLDPSQEQLIGLEGRKLRNLLKTTTKHPELYLEAIEGILAARVTHMGEELLMTDDRIVARDYIPIFDKSEYRGYLLLYRDITREKRVDASKSEFMSLASHQLRTPLTTIRWTLGRLERRLGGSVEAQDLHLLQEGKKATGRMADTIDTMLAISRIEAGKVKLEISRVTLDTLASELLDAFRDDQIQKQLSLNLDSPAQIELMTDAKFLREILSNIVSNAVKYTPQGGTINVRVRNDGNNVVIDVEDSGYGIPLHQQEKIFSKFFRGDNVLQYDTNGTGLGLYLVYLLTRILRGHISFASQEGRGTVFTLRLPREFSAA